MGCSQQELADYLGVSRQVVNGYLRDWQRAGLVDLSRGSITMKRKLCRDQLSIK